MGAACHPWRGARILGAGLLAVLLAQAPAPAAAAEFDAALQALSALGDRSPGTPGAARAAAFLRREFERLGLGEVHVHRFHLPVMEAGEATLLRPGRPEAVRLAALAGNAVTPPAVEEAGVLREVVYLGDGDPAFFAGRPVEGAIVLMEFDSGRNWLLAADLGARALVYVDRGGSPRMRFEETFELSPVDFPRFWAPLETLRAAFGYF